MPQFGIRRTKINMVNHLIHKLKHLIVTLRFSILSIFISLFIFTTVLIIIITSIRFTHTLSTAATQLMGYASTSVLRELTAGIRPAAIETKFAAHLIENDILNVPQISEMKDPDLMPFTYYLIKNMPFAISAYWGDKYGNFIYTKKEKDGTITTDIYKRQHVPATRTTIYRDKLGYIIKREPSSDLVYDPRMRPWYIEAQEKKKTIWTDIYFFHFFQRVNQGITTGITTASPVFKNNHFYGAFGIDINLDYLSQFTTNQIITPNGFSFIITNEGKLVAYPKRKPFVNLNVPAGQFINVNSVDLPLIRGSFEHYKQSGKKNLTFYYNVQGKSYLVTYEPIKDLAAYGWLVGVVVPEDDFTSSLNKINIIALSISLIVLILGIILVSSLITEIVKPIKLLVKETENIKNFNLEGEISIKSKIKEVLYLKDAIHAMKIGLKLFQRYIPKTLVRQLIESGEDIRVGGVRKKLAVFFSDIEDFTAITERIDPNLLMLQLCDYFEELSKIIFNENGTIDKYIGDAIMAFWGAPLPDDEPCYHAAYAALNCQTKLNELNALWKKQGKPQLITRIGLHSGDAVVGNLGSSERLNYTALGDTINIASRLEGINKTYNTKIIVSETVYEQIKDKFVLRMLDCVIVKGRTKSSCLYELLSDDIAKVPFDINAYRPTFEHGFSAYQYQRWDEALSSFKRCLQLYPADNIAPIFIERCTHLKANPPGPEWNGVSTMRLTS
jgi:adenylate cyclase